MNLRPLGDRLIVEPASKEEVSKGGIILPDMAKERPEQGKVMAVGPGRLLDTGTRALMNVKVGDTILFKKYSPDEVKLDDKEYLVISESDVMAVVE